MQFKLPKSLSMRKIGHPDIRNTKHHQNDERRYQWKEHTRKWVAYVRKKSTSSTEVRPKRGQRVAKIGLFDQQTLNRSYKRQASIHFSLPICKSQLQKAKGQEKKKMKGRKGGGGWETVFPITMLYLRARKERPKRRGKRERKRASKDRNWEGDERKSFQWEKNRKQKVFLPQWTLYNPKIEKEEME